MITDKLKESWIITANKKEGAKQQFKLIKMALDGNINSWMHSKRPSLNDKIKELLQIHYKLVLVQADELRQIKLRNDKNKFIPYIDYLYDHYIVKGLPKTYLCNNN